jgi:hypothetical protein
MLRVFVLFVRTAKREQPIQNLERLIKRRGVWRRMARRVAAVLGVEPEELLEPVKEAQP